MAHLITPRRAALASLLLSGSLVALGACKKKDSAEAAETTKAVVISPQEIAVIEDRRIETGPSMSGSLAAVIDATIRADVAGAVVQSYVD
jgi:hypothetical protein